MAEETDLTEAERAERQAMMDTWHEALNAASLRNGRLSAVSAMFVVALETLRTEVGGEMLAMLLDGLAGKVREGKPITLRDQFGTRPH